MLFNRFKKLVNRVSVLETQQAGTGLITGGAFYKDSEYTSGSPLVIDDARTQLTIDGLGPVTDTGQLPVEDHQFWENDAIRPIKAGDHYMLRIDFKAKMAQASAYAQLQLDIGGESQVVIVDRVITFPRGANVDHSVSLAFPVFVGNSFLANGGKIYFDTTGGSDTLSVWEAGIFITRLHSPT